ncbi:MAG: M20 family metallo-hydrolase [Spirochaetaceae bacterium]|jgi:succinyl-diaminopimelate desuccinylase|nr:M20 family metallo-hydrolase [Spirochaetaceae bacterium]
MDAVYKWIDEHRALAVELERELCKRPAVSPDSGGEGELDKAEFLQNWLREHGITAQERYDAPCANAKGKCRPNLIAKIDGGAPSNSGSLWFIAHLDVVPPGEASLWHSDPWTLIIKGKDGTPLGTDYQKQYDALRGLRLVGRGTEDNQQGLCAACLAALALLAAGRKPKREVRLLFAADEECGSVYGIDYLLKNHPGLFTKADAALIPDSGAADGLEIEVAEKNMLWLRARTAGKQTHGSRPDLGANAHLAAADFALTLHNELSKTFNKRDPLFDPPYSTFEPTKREANVPNINTIPGDDILYFDMRILPCYTNAEVLQKTEEIQREIEKKYGVQIELSLAQTHESPATGVDAPLVLALSREIQAVYGGKARPVGIGGGTVAAFLRNVGIDAAVWSRLDDTAHQPDEYALLDNIISDAKVMAGLMLNF